MSRLFSAGKKHSAKLFNELHRFVEAGKAGDYGVLLRTEGLSHDEADIIRLINTAFNHFRRADSYLNLRHELTINSLGIVIWDMNVVNADYLSPGTKITWSQELREMLGYEGEHDFPSSLSSWYDNLHPEDKERASAAISAHLHDYTGQTPFDIEYRIKKKDGDYLWVRAFGTSQRDSAGIPVRVAGGFIDIQDFKQMQSQAKIMSSIVHNSPSCVSYKKISGECLYVNPSASSITGYSHDELMKDYVGAVFGDKAAGITKELLANLREKSVVRYQYAGKRKDGEERIFAGTSFMIEEDAYGTIAADITETQRTEDRLKDANERLTLMLDTCPLCTQIFDRNLTMIECNEACVKIYGFNSKQELFDEYIGRCFPDLQPDGQKSLEKAAVFLDKAFKEGRCEFDWTIQIPADGRLIPTEVTLVRAEYHGEDVVLAYTRVK
jgi:PAS domain S-box-containing protein